MSAGTAAALAQRAQSRGDRRSHEPVQRDGEEIPGSGAGSLSQAACSVTDAFETASLQVAQELRSAGLAFLEAFPMLGEHWLQFFPVFVRMPPV